MSITRVMFGALCAAALCGSAACSTKFKSATNPGDGSSTPGATMSPTGTGGTHATQTGSGGATAGGSGGMTGTSIPSGSGGSSAGSSGNPHGGSAGDGAGSGTGGTAAPIGDAGSTSDGGVVMPEPMQTCPSMVLPPGDSPGSVMVGGTMRNYILHVPPNYTGQTPVPLVTDWHPILTDDTFEQGNSGYSAKADSEGFIVVWPNGIDNAWNVGSCCTTSRDVDDVGFARALIDQIEQEACIDKKRVYAVGYSMGGGMSYKLACDAADIIAAVAPSAFQLMVEDEWPCKPSRPITVISFNGTADFIVPYAGGASNPPNGLPITNHFLGAQGTFDKWSQLDGCAGMPTDMGNGCSTYSQCKDGVEVTLCLTQGGGHDTGDPNVGWDMLKKHPLP